MYTKKNINRIANDSSYPVQNKVSDHSGFYLEDKRPDTVIQMKRQDTVSAANKVVQLNGKKEGKMRAGMPKKAKGGSKEKQQSKAQRAFNAIQSYRTNFCQENNVTVAHVTQYLKEGHQLHGHASADSNSKENSATTHDADAFVGWFRGKYG
jgi:hypothetical protein